MRAGTVSQSKIIGEVGSVRPVISPLLGYAVATGFVTLAAIARLSLDSLLGQEVLPYAFLYLGVILTAWLVGFRPAVFALCLGLLVSIWLVVPPRHAFAVRGFAGYMEIVLYVFITGTSIMLVHSLRRAREKAETSFRIARQKQADLEAEVHQRELTEAALRESEERLRKNEEVLELKVEDRTAKLQEMVHELEHFSYALMHDMRAPLRAMQSFAGLIEEECGDMLPAESQTHLRRIKAASHRLDRLVQDSLNYSRVVRQDLPLYSVDLPLLLRGLVETYPNLSPQHSDIHIETSMPRVLGNDAALTQCFANLLDNAVKFVPQGTRPKVRVWANTTDQAGMNVRVWVEDNGTGIPLQLRDRIFGMFQRHNVSFEGTGIGLAIVRKLTERMGGKVGVESTEGKGSRFWVELKRADAHIANGPKTASVQ